MLFDNPLSLALLFAHLCEYLYKYIKGYKRRSTLNNNKATVSLINMRCLIEHGQH
jgi:hypothetical protein